jgi:hypothetical protein
VTPNVSKSIHNRKPTRRKILSLTLSPWITTRKETPTSTAIGLSARCHQPGSLLCQQDIALTPLQSPSMNATSWPLRKQRDRLLVQPLPPQVHISSMLIMLPTPSSHSPIPSTQAACPTWSTISHADPPYPLYLMLYFTFDLHLITYRTFPTRYEQ